MRTAPTDLLTVAQAAEVLAMPTRTLHQWIANGRVTATKLGTGRTNAYVITRAEVERVKAEAAA